MHRADQNALSPRGRSLKRKDYATRETQSESLKRMLQAPQGREREVPLPQSQTVAPGSPSHNSAQCMARTRQKHRCQQTRGLATIFCPTHHRLYFSNEHNTTMQRTLQSSSFLRMAAQSIESRDGRDVAQAMQNSLEESQPHAERIRQAQATVYGRLCS